jgi:ABC-type transport system involved in cytochrome bd biosynthesis fused ATPase/permease subunit
MNTTGLGLSPSINSAGHGFTSINHDLTASSTSISAPKQYSIEANNLTNVAHPAVTKIPIVGIPIRRRQGSLAKELVRGVNLRVKPGELAVIIGGSGSGKSAYTSTRSHQDNFDVAVNIHADKI